MTDLDLLSLCCDRLEYNGSILIWRSGRRKGRGAGYFNKKGYCCVKIDSKLYRAHRLIFLMHFGYLPVIVDHIDGNPRNNCLNNLRATDHQGNNYNSGMRKNNSSGYKGVTWHRSHNKWCAKIGVGNRRIYLGYFTCKYEAAKAYNDAAIKYHGEFAKLNVIEAEENGN
jgi:hypothetical protein